MEELLNKLIQKGWKPRGYEDVYEFKLYKLGYTIARPQKQKMISFATETRHYINGTDYIGYKGYSLRELVSKESGLRQFCVENKLVKEDDGHITRIINLYKDDGSIVDGGWDYHYWLMICSILDESELEQFLLENIKV